MNGFSTIKLCLALSLAAILLFGTSFQKVHHLVDHEEAEKHCESDGAEQHFHGEEYAIIYCPICEFTFSELSRLTTDLTIRPAEVQPFKKIWRQKTILPAITHYCYCLRGPPGIFTG